MNANAVTTPNHDRSKFLGGSDIAAILGVSPWRTVVDLWEDKITPRSDQPRKKVFQRGERWESVVAEMLTLDLESQGHKVEIIGRNRRFIDAEHPMFAAEIDFEVRLDDEPDITNVEIKTVHPFRMREWGDSGSDELPVWYTAQAMWGLGVAPDRRQRCIMAPLFGADELRTFEILRDDETLAGMRARAVSFWTENVVARIPPEPITLEDLAKIFPKHVQGPALLADSNLEELVLRLRAIKSEIKARESEGELIEFQLKRAMKDCAELLVDGETAATWKTRPASWLDQAALKEQHPDIHKKFMRKGEARVFLLK